MGKLVLSLRQTSFSTITGTDMHTVITQALARLPANSESPRQWSYEIPEHFSVENPIFKIHLRIDTPSYRRTGHPGWQSDHARETFETEMHQIMAAAGMAKDNGYFFPEDGSDDENIYTHPDDISGMMTIDRALAVINVLDTGGFGSTLRWVDVYEVHERLSDEEALKRFEFSKATIRQRILDACQTKRKTTFKYLELTTAVHSVPGFSFVGKKSFGTNFSAFPPALAEALGELRDNLVQEGWLKAYESDTGTVFRTANKTEQRVEGLLKKAKTKSDMNAQAALL